MWRHSGVLDTKRSLVVRCASMAHKKSRSTAMASRAENSGHIRIRSLSTAPSQTYEDIVLATPSKGNWHDESSHDTSYDMSGIDEASSTSSTLSSPIHHTEAATEKLHRQQEDTGQQDTQDIPLWKSLPAWIPICCWLATSSFVIFQNNHILTSLHFRHPVTLTTFHLLFQTISTQVLRRTTRLLDSAKDLETSGAMSPRVYLTQIVPIGILFSASLVIGNWVYLLLSVSFIQMLKASAPVAILLVSTLLGLKSPSQTLVGIVLLISAGVAIASYGEIQFQLAGFVLQVAAIFIEAFRIVLVQILLHGIRLDPLTSLYYTAPVCLVANAIMLPLIDGPQVIFDALQVIGLPLILFNASMTLLLNICSVWLIASTSGLALTLSGVLKDVILILGSWIFLGSHISLLQVLGYSLAIAGLVAYKEYH